MFTLDANQLRQIDALERIHQPLLRALERWRQRCPPMGSSPGTAVVLFRHSIRGPIPRSRDQRDVPITDAGRALATRLGRQFAGPVARVSSSPMRRCQETARYFIFERDEALDIHVTEMLGDPGAYVQDVDHTWSAYLQHGKHVLVELLLGEASAPRGYYPLAHGTRRLCAALIHDLPVSGLGIAFSHDIIMATFLGFTRGRALTRDEWPDFHEGCLIEIAATSLSIHYRDQQWSFELGAESA